jgi:Icc-related predicted phosphoesterase
MIPEDTDILVTHGPPKYILDMTRGEHAGDLSLFKHVTERVKPKLHIFGHFHDEDSHINSGERKLNGLQTRFINASIVNLRHRVVNHPMLIKYE